VLHSIFYVYRHVPEKIHHVRADFQFRLGERDPVFSGFDPEIYHRPLPEVAAADGFAREVFLPALPARTEFDRNFHFHAFLDRRCVYSNRLCALHLQRIHPEGLRVGFKIYQF
jgi:hypothetical protein